MSADELGLHHFLFGMVEAQIRKHVAAARRRFGVVATLFRFRAAFLAERRSSRSFIRMRTRSMSTD